MKVPIAVAVLALGAAGCATQEATQYAKADCKIVPMTTAGGKGRPATALEMRQAEMDLAASRYRQQQLAQHGQIGNTVEDALRDCATR
jgi:hypothetical protein